MNIVNKLTLRQLMLNKKRTLITVVGTIISAAMITAVATLGLSFLDSMVRESIRQNGEWHAKYMEISKEELGTLQAASRVKATILEKVRGYAYLEGSGNSNKPYLYVMEYNQAGFEHLPIELTEGRLPAAPGELVVSEAISANAGAHYGIGDRINLDIGHRVAGKEEENRELRQIDSIVREGDEVCEYLTKEEEKNYTIVGMIKSPEWEYAWAPGYTVISYLDENTLAQEERCNALALFYRINNKLFDNAKEILPEAAIIFNNDLLRYHGIYASSDVQRMIYTLSAIIMVIIVLGSVALIYNAFAISVAERSRYLGMLSSVGATRRQKRNSVFFEGAVIGAVSIPAGIVSGYLGLGITYLCINPAVKGALGIASGFRLKVYPSSLIASAVISGVTILISTWLPARKASNISAIDAIRQSSEIKITGRQVRTWGITRKIFGIEGELGLKNLKRSRGRYQATIFSLVISMLLFLVVTQFTDMIRKSYTMTQDGIDFDITASVSGTVSERAEMIRKLGSLENIREYSRVDSISMFTWVEEEDTPDYLKEGEGALKEDGRYQYHVIVNALEDKALKEYAKKAGVDYGLLADSKQPAAIVVNKVSFKDVGKDKYVETKAIRTEPGMEYVLMLSDENSRMNDIGGFRVVGTTDELPMGIQSSGSGAAFHIIMSIEALDRLMENTSPAEKEFRDTDVFFRSRNPVKLQEVMEKLQDSVGASRFSLYNLYIYRQREEQMMLLISVFTYAFLALITAICIANIINTISTSITLRKREFAMLKSVGITPGSFNRMLNYESIFYGIKALIYGIPISIAVMYLVYRSLMENFDFAFSLPLTSIGIVIVSVFLIVGSAMLYSSSKVRKENIIDALRQEII